MRSRTALAALLALGACTGDRWVYRPFDASTAVDAGEAADAGDAPVVADAPEPSGRVVQFVTAGHATYAVRDDRTVFAAGEGVGAFEGVESGHRNTFVAVPGLTDVVEVSVASTDPPVVCARRSDGTVRCRVGSTDPVDVEGLTARRIAGPCALTTDGGVACWDLGDFRPTPVALTDATGLASNGRLHCAVRRDNTVWCWGEVGAVMDVPASARTTGVPERVEGVSTATAVGVGRLSACAAVDLGVVCWGRRPVIDGGPDVNTGRPVAVPGTRGARTLTANSALTADGRVLAWGHGSYGTRGDGTYDVTSTAGAVPGFTARSIAEGDGELRVCAADEEGRGWCWGEDGSGELGVRGGRELVPLPVLADPGDATSRPLDDVVDTMLSAEAQCALLANGTVRCWGCDANGGTGRGVIGQWPSWQPAPTAVPGLSGVTALPGFGSTQNETFGALVGDRVRMWGQGASGALGNNTTQSRATPGAPSSLGPAARLVVGEGHTCAVLADGTVSCWGLGASGQLGDGNSSGSAVPVAVARLTSVVDVALGSDVSVALRGDGSMHLWGRSAWILPTSTLNSTPVALPLLRDAVELALLTPHNFRQLCARRSNGRVSCLGSNLPFNDRWVDMGLEGVTQIAAGASGTGCARHDDGGVSCWGVNRNGELGDARRSNADGYHPPGRVMLSATEALDRVTRVRVGIGDVCAVRDDRQLWCWGTVNHGVTGRGRAVVEPRPRRVIGL